MKKLYILSIIIGIISIVGIFLISAYSNNLNQYIKTFGFIILGYIGVISFAYGWMKLFKKK